MGDYLRPVIFPPEVTLSYRDIEDLLAERGLMISNECRRHKGERDLAGRRRLLMLSNQRIINFPCAQSGWAHADALPILLERRALLDGAEHQSPADCDPR
jgi:hypothetical protein